MVNELFEVAAFVATLELTDLEVCLSHFLFFSDDIEQSFGLGVRPESLLGCRHRLFWSYKKNLCQSAIRESDRGVTYSPCPF